ncbi:hypothetical protein BDK51DRAFT_35265 [Blyttiomyces helicus]|uniref:Uncharacterized protein n=1 Tax=Blyttiomyces helicus TaxID=388810 RepID=A0A4P9WK61_9FUNG|nr:hypothetical protein BDK51DRAFT_35265 [Blyttiomyces helicus]|eukprot:RKO93351.1 hypothetical protein BDK51DRAFT_35265 [Blyttiomyces helicus]
MADLPVSPHPSRPPHRHEGPISLSVPNPAHPVIGSPWPISLFLPVPASCLIRSADLPVGPPPNLPPDQLAMANIPQHPHPGLPPHQLVLVEFPLHPHLGPPPCSQVDLPETKKDKKESDTSSFVMIKSSVDTGWLQRVRANITTSLIETKFNFSPGGQVLSGEGETIHPYGDCAYDFPPWRQIEGIWPCKHFLFFLQPTTTPASILRHGPLVRGGTRTDDNSEKMRKNAAPPSACVQLKAVQGLEEKAPLFEVAITAFGQPLDADCHRPLLSALQKKKSGSISEFLESITPVVGILKRALSKNSGKFCSKKMAKMTSLGELDIDAVHWLYDMPAKTAPHLSKSQVWIVTGTAMEVTTNGSVQVEWLSGKQAATKRLFNQDHLVVILQTLACARAVPKKVRLKSLVNDNKHYYSVGWNSNDAAMSPFTHPKKKKCRRHEAAWNMGSSLSLFQLFDLVVAKMALQRVPEKLPKKPLVVHLKPKFCQVVCGKREEEQKDVEEERVLGKSDYDIGGGTEVAPTWSDPAPQKLTRTSPKHSLEQLDCTLQSYYGAFTLRAPNVAQMLKQGSDLQTSKANHVRDLKNVLNYKSIKSFREMVVIGKYRIAYEQCLKFCMNHVFPLSQFTLHVKLPHSPVDAKGKKDAAQSQKLSKDPSRAALKPAFKVAPKAKSSRVPSKAFAKAKSAQKNTIGCPSTCKSAKPIALKGGAPSVTKRDRKKYQMQLLTFQQVDFRADISDQGRGFDAAFGSDEILGAESWRACGIYLAETNEVPTGRIMLIRKKRPPQQGILPSGSNLSAVVEPPGRAERKRKWHPTERSEVIIQNQSNCSTHVEPCGGAECKPKLPPTELSDRIAQSRNHPAAICWHSVGLRQKRQALLQTDVLNWSYPAAAVEQVGANRVSEINCAEWEQWDQ